VTVLEGIQKSADFLAKKGIESARLQAELLLSNILKLPRMKLYLNFDRILTQSEVDTLRDHVRRRGQHEPLQHIIGSISFCGIELVANGDALIPRPETELLAEAGWRFLSSVDSERSTAWDIGTGSGCIAITLAMKCPNLRIAASDISVNALELAKRNAAANNVTNRIEFLNGDGFSPVSQDRQFDLIISNPPYIPTAEIETLQPEVRDFDPHIALNGGEDGLDFYRRFAVEAVTFLKPHGKLMLEFGDGQAEAVKKIFENQKWVVEAVREDYTQRPRILIAKPPAVGTI
jgi:release factor glutamine methyltransferase